METNGEKNGLPRPLCYSMASVSLTREQYQRGSMDTYRTTVVVKTDIVGFTPLVGSLTDSELQTLLGQQKSLISGIVSENDGSIIKGEGDSFYITFPSVTTAALAAIQMHERLHLQQVGRGDDENLAIRIVIAVGDLLHKDNDVFGNAMNLVARIEDITPANEIYLTHAAWLLLNKSEVQSEFVGTFSLKGVSEPEKVFRVEQRHRTKILTDQFIFITDVRGWTTYVKSNPLTAVENLLIQLDDVINMISTKYGGVVRNVIGDEYFLTFADANSVLSAAAALNREWDNIAKS